VAVAAFAVAEEAKPTSLDGLLVALSELKVSTKDLKCSWEDIIAPCILGKCHSLNPRLKIVSNSSSADIGSQGNALNETSFLRLPFGSKNPFPSEPKSAIVLQLFWRSRGLSFRGFLGPLLSAGVAGTI
jgi:hypothetical protein